MFRCSSSTQGCQTHLNSHTHCRCMHMSTGTLYTRFGPGWEPAACTPVTEKQVFLAQAPLRSSAVLLLLQTSSCPFHLALPWAPLVLWEEEAPQCRRRQRPTSLTGSMPASALRDKKGKCRERMRAFSHRSWCVRMLPDKFSGRSRIRIFDTRNVVQGHNFIPLCFAVRQSVQR